VSARRLAALVVNHRSGAWALQCVESLRLEWERSGRAAEDLELVVVDSGSGEDEAPRLDELERRGVRVLRAEENLGYAASLCLGHRVTRGAPDDAVALLNPDLLFLPGSLAPLLEALDDPRVGAVGPRVYLDEELQVQLPPSELPTPRRELLEALAARSPRLARWRAAARTRRARRWWGSEEPLRSDMLSGACLFLRRGVVDDLGGPMDPAYPLYFEDSDLCARLSARGLRLLLEPASEVLHHWSRSAGPVFAGEVARRHAVGRARYLGRHHRGPLDLALRGARALLERLAPAGGAALHAFEPLGASARPPELDLGRPGGALLELSLTPFFGLAAGVLVDERRYRLPARTWSWMFPGTYFLRALDLETGELIGAWSLVKEGAARSWPLDPEAIPARLALERPGWARERAG
jgi:N-acetylglucosaminyl-diphospho-decaprenol L-rhamnosyltransferase